MVVSISTVVTMVIALVASRNPKPEHRGGGGTRQQQRTGEEAAGSDTWTGVPQPVTLGENLSDVDFEVEDPHHTGRTATAKRSRLY